MSSAFPQQTSQNIFGPAAAAIPVPERGTHIPALYVRNPHRDPEHTVVKQGGIPLKDYNGNEFVVAQVAPERRWAILEDGEIMSVEAFKPAYQAKILEYYEMLKSNGHPDAKYVGNLDAEPIPHPRYYVRWTVDPMDSAHLREIGYDPNATDGSVPEFFYDKKGDKIEAARIDVLCQAYASPKGRKQMTKSEIEEVETYLGIAATSAAGSDLVASKLEVLTELFNDQAISEADYLRRVMNLTGAAEESEPEPEVSEAKQPTTARCGAQGLKGNGGKLAHERRCKKCRELAEEADS